MKPEIHRDAWGIPHLRTRTPLELAHAQGWATARDRSGQLERERRRAEGTSAAVLGAGALPWDTFARRARLADTARRCFAELERRDAGTAGWVRAYAEGVNEGLRDAGARGGGGQLAGAGSGAGAGSVAGSVGGQVACKSPEFDSTVPGEWSPWTPMAVWLSTHILFTGFPAKLWRETARTHLGPESIGLFATDGPGTAGSNGWLLTAARTTTGHPLLAGDPHRYIEDPGIYQQIHLACDDYDVVGLAVPGVPGLAHFGHTGTVAWSITNAMADYQDLYRERLRRTGAGVEALGPDGSWRRVSRHTEHIEVAGEPPVEVEILETERGPVIAGGPEGLEDGTQLAISLRHPPRVTGDLGFSALPALLNSRTVQDVDRALDAWCEPVNVVQAADTDGGVLHRVAGRVPVRAEANRLGVVPAWEPGHEWRGWREMPRAEVADGVAVMANQRGIAGELGVEFAPRHRADRIRELLERRPRWTPDESAEIHMDTQLPSAGPLLDALARLPDLELTREASALRAALLTWNRHMDADSYEAGAYAAVRTEVVRALAAHPAFAALATPPAYPEVLLPWLELAPRIGFALEHLLRAEELYGIDRAGAVQGALEKVAGRPARTWGETHRLRLGQAQLENPPLSGDHDCVLCTSAVPGVTDRAFRGPAARYIWDLARRDNSSWVVPHGAQLPLWLRGELAPVVTDWSELHVHVQQTPPFGEIRIRPVTPERDAETIHRWTQAERAHFWGMEALTAAQVQEIYAHMATLDTHNAYLADLNGTPVALFQLYDPAADRVGECYDVQDGDVGVHVLLAPPVADVQQGWSGALLGALAAYVFQVRGFARAVVDPDLRNEKAIARFLRQGFEPGPVVRLPEVDLPDVHLPEKKAQLAFLDRRVAFPE